MSSTLGDRLWWARRRAGYGANRLTREAGCAQSLISTLERNNAERSKYTKAFATILGVDPVWLAHGVDDRAPPDFDEKDAREGRERMHIRRVRTADPRRYSTIEPFARPTHSVGPAWAAPEKGDLSPADAMMKSLVNTYMDFVKTAGHERARRLLETLSHVANLISVEEASGQDQLRTVNQGDDRTDH